MGKSLTFLVICATAFVVIHMLSAVTASAGAHTHLTWMPAAGSCSGSIGDCLSDEFEFDLDSEINRRVLAARKRYISYDALSRNTAPCSRRGASYYNCRQGAQANPYNRGCSAITRCRR